MEKKNSIKSTMELKNVRTEVIKADEAKVEFEISFSNPKGMIEYLKLFKKIFEEIQ